MHVDDLSVLLLVCCLWILKVYDIVNDYHSLCSQENKDLKQYFRMVEHATTTYLI